MSDLGAGSTNEVRPTHQPGDGGSNPTSALQFVIRPVDHGTAKSFIEKWHYSKCIPTGKNILYGLYAGESLYAVIVYGIGVNPYQARFLGVRSVLEIKRMCRSEPPLGYQLSRFIAITLRFVRKDYDPDCIVAFADPEQGHEGTVYSASGFARHGMTNAEWHVIGEDGVKRHRRYPFRYAQRNGCTIAEARERLGLKRIQTLPKIRWVKMLKTAP
jgi:hypothetical protein